MRLPICLLACPAILLAGCGDDPELAVAEDGRSASGEVLEGTISDAMIATDALRSQPPLLKQSGREGEGASGSSAAAVDPTPDEPESEAPAPDETAPSDEE